MSTVGVNVTCDALPPGTAIVSLHGEEAMNAFTLFEVGIVCGEVLDRAATIGASATVTFIDEAEGTTRLVGLIVAAVESRGQGRDGGAFVLGLRPPEHLLTLRSNHRVFVDKTTEDIVSEVLRDAGFPEDQVVWNLRGAYLPRFMAVQYGETDWAFIERLLAEEGIAFFFSTTDEGKPQLILCDNPAAHDDIVGTPLLPFEDQGGNLQIRHFFELEAALSFTPNAVHVIDYDLRAPDVPIEGKAGEGGREYFEYPARVLTSEVAAARARVRLEQLKRDEDATFARSNCIRLGSGRAVTVEACADEWMNRKYLIVSAEHTIVLGARSETSTRAYSNRVVMVPLVDRTYRPAVGHARPALAGVASAIVTGAAGEEIHVDDLARVKLRYAWDRGGKTDDTSSAWVRTLQLNMSGAMILPRVGWEVPVAHVDGDPDRPLVLGRMYNATAVLPYGMPGKKATTTLQSATSPGGGSTNEIRMADDAGAQEFFMHATKDQEVTVGGSAVSKVGANETHDVGLSLIAKVTGSDTHTVGASQTVNVGTDYGITIKGSRSETVGGAEYQKITANRVVGVKGGYTEIVGALYGIQCNQANYSVKGAFTEIVGSSMALAGGLGVSETVVATRTELVGAAKKLVTAGAYSEKVRGAKSVTAGATKEKAGGGISTAAKGVGEISVGGSVKLTAGGPIVLEAPSITIEAASLDATEMSLSGGTMRIKKGKSKFKGTIKRQGGAKVQK
ncbi:type VI secretion system Vgr family protein [Chondromyces apiculatus]|uniref:type VI secretion system Vgr family protein n=1 Tax=Chondromyces apiculatus TaxID=51 RepID=UPI0005C7835C|nr:type VI secretion system tip protein TssI/VgrG [Chondromyces apiculatus]